MMVLVIPAQFPHSFRTVSAQISEELTLPKMRFPKIVHHKKAQVTIYGKKKNYPFYRIIYRADGKRRMQPFAKYSDALKAAEEKAEQLWKAHPVVALSAVQTRDAIIPKPACPTSR
jgi:hypothetical protein